MEEKETADRPPTERFEEVKKKQIKKQEDALIQEVEEDNRKIKNPNERRRVIPSDPC